MSDTEETQNTLEDNGELSYFKAGLTLYIVHRGIKIDALHISSWLIDSALPFMLSEVTKSQIRINSNDRINFGGFVNTVMLDRKPRKVIFPSFDLKLPEEVVLEQ